MQTLRGIQLFIGGCKNAGAEEVSVWLYWEMIEAAHLRYSER